MTTETAAARVFLTRQLPPAPMKRLSERTRLTLNHEDRVLERNELLEAVADVSGLLCLLTDRVDEELMDASPGLKVVANYAVGYNNIDVPAATKRGILVTNTPDVLT